MEPIDGWMSRSVPAPSALLRMMAPFVLATVLAYVLIATTANPESSAVPRRRRAHGRRHRVDRVAAVEAAARDRAARAAAAVPRRRRASCARPVAAPSRASRPSRCCRRSGWRCTASAGSSRSCSWASPSSSSGRSSSSAAPTTRRTGTGRPSCSCSSARSSASPRRAWCWKVRNQAAEVAGHTRDLQRVAAISRELATSSDARGRVCEAAIELAAATFAFLMEPDGAGSLVSTAMAGLDAPTVRSGDRTLSVERSSRASRCSSRTSARARISTRRCGSATALLRRCCSSRSCAAARPWACW